MSLCYLFVFMLSIHDTPNTNTVCKYSTPLFRAMDLKVINGDAAKEIGALFEDELQSCDGIGAIRQVKNLLPVGVFGV